MLTYVIDGPDGLGKTTLCQNLARLVTERVPGCVGVHVGMPNNSIQMFRDMFLAHVGYDLSIEKFSAVWTKPTELYGASAPLLVLANMCHTYAALTEYDAHLPKNKELVVFVDREIPSTLAYQFAFDVSTGNIRNPLSVLEFTEIYDKVMEFIPRRSGLILLSASDEYPAKIKAENKFDHRNQTELNDFFGNYLRQVYYGPDEHPLKSWLIETYDYLLWFESMAYTPDQLANMVFDQIKLL